MKKQYNAPVAEITEFNSADMTNLTTSGVNQSSFNSIAADKIKVSNNLVDF